MLPTYVLTIPRLSERREQFINRWKHTGLEYEFYEGLDFETLTSHIPRNRYAQRVLPQFCIAHSHFSIFEKFYETREDYCIIMEDDAAPTKHWETLDWDKILAFEFQVLKLYSMVIDPLWSSYQPQYHRELIDGLFVNLQDKPLSTTAFIITRKVVEKLFDYGFNDFKIEFLIDNKAPLTYGLWPQPVAHISDSSYIDYQVGNRPWRKFNPNCR